jgi:phage host-nuclease inhibitor protein Gam
MKRIEFYRLYDMLEEIKGLEKMIQLHSDDESDFMLKQYKAKKEKLTGKLIDQLVTPPLMSARSIHTIKMIIDRFYGNEIAWKNDQSLNDDFSKLELALT